MDDLLHEIRFIPGVVGSFVYVERQGVRASDLPDRFGETALRQVGRVVNRLFHVRGVACMGVGSLDVAFEDLSLSARKVREDVALVTLGDDTVNNEFVAMTVDSMLGEIQAVLAEGGQSVAPAEGEAPRVSRQTPPPLAEALPETAPDPVPEPGRTELPNHATEQLRVCLAKELGPIASVILGETLSAWQRHEEATVQDLVELLAAEVAKGPSREVFRRAAQDILSRLVVAEIAPASGPGQPAAAPIQEIPAAVLQSLGAALAKAIGPISRLVLNDAVDAWKQDGPGTRDRLPELIDALCREISDPKAAAAFRQEVAQA